MADFLGENIVNELYMHAFDRRVVCTQDFLDAGFDPDLVGPGLTVLLARGLIMSEGEDHWSVVPPSRSLPPLAARLEERARLIRTSLPGLTSAYRTAGRALEGPQLHGVEFLAGTQDIAFAMTQCFAQAHRGVKIMRRDSIASRKEVFELMPSLKEGRVGVAPRILKCVTVIQTDLAHQLSADDLQWFERTPRERLLLSGHVPFTVVVSDADVAVIELLRNGEPEGFLISNPGLARGLLEVVDLVIGSATPWSRSKEATTTSTLEAAEEEILHLLAVGVPDATIARRLDISPRTFDRRLRSILDKLGAATRFQAGVMAGRRGWL